MSFTFNNQTAASLGLGVTDIRRSIMPEIRRVTQEAAGMHGSYMMTTTVGERIIEIDVNFSGTSLADAAADTHTLAQALWSPTPLELVFDDEPDLIYYAQLDGSTDLEAIGTFRMGTLVFACSDPFAYSDTETEVAITAVGATEVTNGGGMDTFPVIEVTLDGSTTFLQVSNDVTGEFVRIGEPYDGVGTPAEPMSLELDETMSGETMEWTHTTIGPPDHTTKLPTDPTNPMEMEATLDEGYTAADFGEAVSPLHWHGPCIYHALTTPITDFQVEVEFLFDCQGDSFDDLSVIKQTMGMFDLYLVDGESTPGIIGTMRLADLWATGAWEQAQVILGNPNTPGDTTTVYNKRTVVEQPGRGGIWWTMRISRVGDLWSWKIDGDGGWFPDGGQGTWADSGSLYDADLAKVAIGMKQYDAFLESHMGVKSVKVYDVTGTGGVSATTVIAVGGDTIAIDMRQGVVTLNDSESSRIPADNGGMVPMNAIVDYASTFFSLPTGTSNVNVAADYGVGATGTVTFTERWL
jgi:predicted phage tail component-like protein